jgi:hypothetical protein
MDQLMWRSQCTPDRAQLRLWRQSAHNFNVNFARLTNGFPVASANWRSIGGILGAARGDAENSNSSLVASVNPNSAYVFAAFFGNIKF